MDLGWVEKNQVEEGWIKLVRYIKLSQEGWWKKIKLRKDGLGLGRIYQVEEGWIKVGSDILS